ncbi:hypothetical protein Droror1_Dr00006518 [Drosera rotundifolia]
MDKGSARRSCGWLPRLAWSRARCTTGGTPVAAGWRRGWRFGGDGSFRRWFMERTDEGLSGEVSDSRVFERIALVSVQLAVGNSISSSNNSINSNSATKTVIDTSFLLQEPVNQPRCVNRLLSKVVNWIVDIVERFTSRTELGFLRGDVAVYNSVSEVRIVLWGSNLRIEWSTVWRSFLYSHGCELNYVEGEGPHLHHRALS